MLLKAPEEFSHNDGVVPPRGFEPLISTLKGWRPRPLDDEGVECTSGSLSSRPGPRPDSKANQVYLGTRARAT